MSEDKRIVLVTGGNRGIGYEAVKQLSLLIPNGTILLGSRTTANGNAAIQKMKDSDPSNPFDNIKVIALDIVSKPSLDDAVRFVKDTYCHLDVLINNSGIASKDGDQDSPAVLEVNVRATIECTKSFLPLIESSNGIIVNVSSEVGTWYMSELSPSSRKIFDQSDKIDTDRTLGWIDDWLSFSKGGETTGEVEWLPLGGMSTRAYFVSKTLLSAWSRGFASKNRTKLAVVCPGYCATELNGNSGPRPASKGGESIIWPVFNDFKSGRFYQDGRECPFTQPIPEAFKSGLV